MNPNEPDQSNSGKSTNPSSKATSKTDASNNPENVPRSIYQEILKAHNNYFAEINSINNNVQERFQEIQVEFERAVEKAVQTRDMNDFMSAQAEYQRKLNEICTEPTLAENYSRLYKNYKEAVRDALYTGNVDELNYTDMAHLSQSLYFVSQMALALEAQGQNFGTTFPQESGQ